MGIIWNVGLGQQTPAVQAAFQGVMRGTRRSSSSRRRKKKAAAPKRRPKAKKSKGGNRFKKGSAAAKAYMAKIRRKKRA